MFCEFQRACTDSCFFVVPDLAATAVSAGRFGSTCVAVAVTASFFFLVAASLLVGSTGVAVASPTSTVPLATALCLALVFPFPLALPFAVVLGLPSAASFLASSLFNLASVFFLCGGNAICPHARFHDGEFVVIVLIRKVLQQQRR